MQDVVTDADQERFEHGEPVLETVLKPGDVLWIPRGWVHAGCSTDEPTLHVSFGFPPFTRYWLAAELFRKLDRCPELRQELPWGIVGRPDLLEPILADVIEDVARYLPTVDGAALAGKLAVDMRANFQEPARSPVTEILAGPVEATTPVVLVSEAILGVDRLPDECTAGSQGHEADPEATHGRRDCGAVARGLPGAVLRRWVAAGAD